MTVDRLLVIRAFEMWIHQEDVRLAAARSLVDPDLETLGPMVARNRQDRAAAGAVVRGDAGLAEAVFVGGAALALD